MVQAEKSEVEPVEADMETAKVDVDAHRLSAECFDILCQHRTGNPMTVVLSVHTCGGLIAWYRLAREFNPKTMARAIRARLQSVNCEM